MHGRCLRALSSSITVGFVLGLAVSGLVLYYCVDIYMYISNHMDPRVLGAWS